jgi:hypothetical protein
MVLYCHDRRNVYVMKGAGLREFLLAHKVPRR